LNLQLSPGPASLGSRYLQGSVFAQLASGLGTNWDTSAGNRQMNLGFLFQPSSGGQLTLNIGWLQVIVQGSVVYSWLSPFAQPASKPTSSWGVQGGIGVGGQFFGP
jgi:hypothetical protein